jgi:hypothetical protein
MFTFTHRHSFVKCHSDRLFVSVSWILMSSGGMVNNKWSNIPTVIYDVITSYMETRERLIIIERICSSFHKHSINGFGWQHNIDLSFPFIPAASSSLLPLTNGDQKLDNAIVSSESPSLTHVEINDQLDNAIISLGITKRLRYHNRIQHLRAYNMTSKVALSMGSWTNLHTFQWISDHHDISDAETKPLIDSLFGLMPSLQTLLITPIIDPRCHQWFFIPSYVPLLQRLEVLPPLSTSTWKPVDLRNTNGTFQLRVCHLPKLSHLSLCDGCAFLVDMKTWHSPLIQSLHFGQVLYSRYFQMIASSLLHTLRLNFVGDTELVTAAEQCPNLQHLSIYEMLNTANDSAMVAIGKMTQLKSLVIDFGNETVPLFLNKSTPQLLSWIHLKSLIHLQRLTIKGCDIKSLKSFPQLIELVQYLSNSHNHQSTTTMSSSDGNKKSIVSNGSLTLMNDMPCHEWLSIHVSSRLISH